MTLIFKKDFWLMILVIAVIMAICPAPVTLSAALAQEDQLVTFSADNVNSNNETGVMVANGNVIIKQGKMELRADSVNYDRNAGIAVASGNVVLTDHQGGVHRTGTLTLQEEFSRAFAEPVISRLVDGSWVSSGKIDYKADEYSRFDDSLFTPCNCDFIDGETPIWELKSATTRHNPASATVYHTHVRMHLFAVPIMYFPYLTHPDWTVRRRSGLMPPEFSFSSDLGTAYSQSYYWVTGETHDLEISPHLFSNNGNALQMLYRQRWDNSSLDAVVTGGRLNTFKKDREDVSAIDANFTTTIGDHWKTTARLYRSSQDTFMRRYGFDNTETLKTHFTTNRISNGSYSLIEAYDFQDLRNNRNNEQEPTILPHIFHERYLESWRDDLLLRLRLSATSINNDDHTDMHRWTSEFYGIEEFHSNYGIFSAEGRFSGQYRNIRTATNNAGYTGELGQASVSSGIGWSLPVAAGFAGRPFVFEPKIKLVSVKATDRSEKIPNRDSSDFRLDEANLFLLHREQGEDYNISHSRVDTGASVDFYDKYLGDVSGFIGSSFRISGQTPTGVNALRENDRISDILASLTIQPVDVFSLSLAGRFHPREYHLNETKAKAMFRHGGTSVSATYNQLARSYFDAADEEKEQLTFIASQELPDDWKITWEQIYDLRDDPQNLVDSSSTDYSSFVFSYGGGIQDCLEVFIGYKRDATTDRDIKPVEEVFLLFSFKYLGGYTADETKR